MGRRLWSRGPLSGKSLGGSSTRGGNPSNSSPAACASVGRYLLHRPPPPSPPPAGGADSLRGLPAHTCRSCSEAGGIPLLTLPSSAHWPYPGPEPTPGLEACKGRMIRREKRGGGLGWCGSRSKSRSTGLRGHCPRLAGPGSLAGPVRGRGTWPSVTVPFRIRNWPLQGVVRKNSSAPTAIIFCIAVFERIGCAPLGPAHLPAPEVEPSGPQQQLPPGRCRCARRAAACHVPARPFFVSPSPLQGRCGRRQTAAQFNLSLRHAAALAPSSYLPPPGKLMWRKRA
jgi:hypothetical protein